MALNYKFIKIEDYGSLALSERPKLKEIPSLVKDNCTAVFTILAERGEQALRIGNEVREKGMAWEWVKVKNAVKMNASEKLIFRRAIKNAVERIKEQENIIVHCSAGLHRTGIFAYCLLNGLGLSEEQSLNYIQNIRGETYNAFEPKYKAIAVELSKT
ncbi:protein-tyrosine phosphatase family protein [Zooshikella ganghwensis]|uniref:Tyrosine specific protein phosphatases domain-containing protein n=1 Tax=Zooshikella ganghwensis TaxID=202772 RepID=A0A4P9VEC8_9GAMM|nr:tyrosine-protein phosphatase [Zooshikella ganghwensis]RDH41415.1 hypothetical protein B9G39_28575 [Zooshikella ganghwensis]